MLLLLLLGKSIRLLGFKFYHKEVDYCRKQAVIRHFNVIQIPGEISNLSLYLKEVKKL